MSDTKLCIGSANLASLQALVDNVEGSALRRERLSDIRRGLLLLDPADASSRRQVTVLLFEESGDAARTQLQQVQLSAPPLPGERCRGSAFVKGLARTLAGVRH